MSTLRAIRLALELAAPHWSPSARATMAEHMAQLERRYHVDAVLMVADIEHESRWQPNATRETRWGRMVGLAQIRDKNLTGCASEGPACEWVRGWLLEPAFNVEEAFRLFSLAKRYCSARGYSLAVHWLQVPTGWDAVRRSTCGHRKGKALPIPKGVQWLMNRKRQLTTK